MGDGGDVTDRSHLLTTQIEPRVAVGGPWWRCRCTCGYRSGLYSGPGGRRRSERAGEAHVERKTADKQEGKR